MCAHVQKRNADHVVDHAHHDMQAMELSVSIIVPLQTCLYVGYQHNFMDVRKE